MSIKLIDEWKHAWKMVSMWCMGLPVAFLGAWGFIPAEFQATIPKEYLMKATAAMLVFGMFGRVVKQGSIPDESKQ